MRLFSNRSQMTSKCGKNKKVAHEAIAECITDVVTTFWRPLWSITELERKSKDRPTRTPNVVFVVASHYQSLQIIVFLLQACRLRLVFTSDGVVVGVVIRGAERYDLVKIKPTESEAEHWFCLWLRCLRSSENCIVGVASRSGRINLWQCSIPEFAIGWFFRFCFHLRQPTFHWIISDGVVNGIGTKLKRSDSSDSDSVSLWLCLRLRFLIFTRS